MKIRHIEFTVHDENHTHLGSYTLPLGSPVPRESEHLHVRVVDPKSLKVSHYAGIVIFVRHEIEIVGRRKWPKVKINIKRL